MKKRRKESRLHQNRIKTADADSAAKKMEESHTNATTDKPIGAVNRDSSCDSTSRPTAQSPRWEILPFMDTGCGSAAQIHGKAAFCYQFHYQYSLISGQCQHYVTKPAQNRKSSFQRKVPGAALCTIGSDKSNYTGGLLQCQMLCEGFVWSGNGYVRQCLGGR